MSDKAIGAIEIEFLSGPRDGDTVFFTTQEIVIGTDPNRDLPLPHDTAAAARHARIHQSEGQLLIENLDGKSTLVNSENIHGTVVLGEADTVQVGFTILTCRMAPPDRIAFRAVGRSAGESLR